mmetsp:Transcript_28554/g.34771  ORF Transcript_28554/g.34771 Transcript_28554/m.34771 type:complete len:206 (-) Transcript_28554:245-862(-)
MLSSSCWLVISEMTEFVTVEPASADGSCFILLSVLVLISVGRLAIVGAGGVGVADSSFLVGSLSALGISFSVFLDSLVSFAVDASWSSSSISNLTSASFCSSLSVCFNTQFSSIGSSVCFLCLGCPNSFTSATSSSSARLLRMASFSASSTVSFIRGVEIFLLPRADDDRRTRFLLLDRFFHNACLRLSRSHSSISKVISPSYFS